MLILSIISLIKNFIIAKLSKKKIDDNSDCFYGAAEKEKPKVWVPLPKSECFYGAAEDEKPKIRIRWSFVIRFIITF